MDSKRKLLTPEREEIILVELGGEARTIIELSQKLGVSEATVRRDLLSLEKQNKIKRVHGGAIKLKFPEHEPVFEEKESIKPSEKRKIAKLALGMIDDKDASFPRRLFLTEDYLFFHLKQLPDIKIPVLLKPEQELASMASVRNMITCSIRKNSFSSWRFYLLIACFNYCPLNLFIL